MLGSYQCPTCGAHYSTNEYDALLDGLCCDLPLRFVHEHSRYEFATLDLTPNQQETERLINRNRGLLTIADLWDEFENAGHSGSEAWRFQADRLHSILMEFTDGTGIGPRRAEFVAERRERGVSDVSAHRMLTVARSLTSWESATLPASMQYQLAKAVEAGGDYAELLSMAQVLSVSDFIDEAFGEKEHAPKLALTCPICGHVGPRDAFAQRKATSEEAAQVPS